MESPISWLYLIQLSAASPAKELDPVQQHYLDILEKTNQQLSLWWNPYGVMIGALGVLFAIAAIVAGFIIHRQGEEFKKTLEEKVSEFRKTLETTVGEYRKIIDSYILEKNAQMEEKSAQIQNELNEVQKQLETASGEERKRLEKRIERLETHQATLKPRAVPILPPGLSIPSSPSGASFDPMSLASGLFFFDAMF